MHIAYWVVAALLAVFYLYSGGMKVFRSPSSLEPMMKWVSGTPLVLVRAIGLVEVIGAISLILPPLTGVAPWLAFAAAVGLVLVQIGALVLHVVRREFRQIGLNVALLVVSCVLVWFATIWL